MVKLTRKTMSFHGKDWLSHWQIQRSNDLASYDPLHSAINQSVIALINEYT